MRAKTDESAVDLKSLLLAGSAAFCLSLAASFGLLLVSLVS